MKRFVTFGVAVLLAATFFDCRAGIFEEDVPEYDGQGRRLVRFSISTGSYGDARG